MEILEGGELKSLFFDDNTVNGCGLAWAARDLHPAKLYLDDRVFSDKTDKTEKQSIASMRIKKSFPVVRPRLRWEK
jgi:hypothetical protein